MDDISSNELLYENNNKTFEQYIYSLRTRLNNNSQQLVITSRSARFDFVGMLLHLDLDDWTYLAIPAVKQRKKSQAKSLWKYKNLYDLKYFYNNATHSGVSIFSSFYQQDPKETDIDKLIEVVLYHKYRDKYTRPRQKARIINTLEGVIKKMESPKRQPTI